MAAVNQKGRSEARGFATNVGQSASTGKNRPAPVAEGEAKVEAPVQPTSIVVIAGNPKRKGSIAYGFYEKYGPVCQMTDANACKERGVRGKDLTWDVARGHILAGPAAEAFPINGSKEEQAQFLLGLAKNSDIELEFRPHEYTEKELIKWGYMPEPAPAEEKKETAEATS